MSSKNLFDYATKELSQDAMLCYLFANYNDPELSAVVVDLLNNFCDLNLSSTDINEIEIQKQWKKIDLRVDIEIKGKDKKIALFIEDKTGSNEHNQLKNYNQEIDNQRNDYEIRKVYYKTSLILDEEEERIKEANENTNTDFPWQIFDIEKIWGILSNHQNPKNLILAQYVEHINNRCNACQNEDLPKSNESSIDKLKWLSFFEKVVRPELEQEKFRCKLEIYQGHYVLLQIRVENKQDDKIPYLELRSSDCSSGDCSNHPFVARFSCYGIDDENPKTSFKEQMDKELKPHKPNSEFFIFQKYEQQVACTPKNVTCSDRNGFVALVMKYAPVYRDLIKKCWK